MKYELTKESKIINGSKVYRIRALEDFNDVKAGDLGGWVQSAENLAMYGNCWIYDEAVAIDEARVMGNAILADNAIMCEYSSLTGNASVSGNTSMYRASEVSLDAKVSGNVILKDNAIITGYALVTGNVNISDNVRVSDSVMLKGNVKLSGDVNVYGNAVIKDNVQVSGKSYIFGNTCLSGNRKLENVTLCTKEDKYKLTDESINYNGINVYRIEALVDFGDITAGTKGGFVESTDNLSQEGKCWIYSEAIVLNKARVWGDAVVDGNSVIKDNAVIRDHATVISSNMQHESVAMHYASVVDSTVSDNVVICKEHKLSNEKVYGSNVYCGGAM